MDEASRTYLSAELQSLVGAARTSWSQLTTEIIPEMLEGEGLSDDASLRWAYDLLGEIWSARLAESQSWERPTDVERLRAAFSALEAADFVCTGIEGSAYTQSDLLQDLYELWAAFGPARERRPRFLGCHAQDIGRAVAGQGLWLAFGRFVSTDKGVTSDADAETASLAVAALRSEGLDVAWDGDPGQRLLLPTFVWRADLPLS